MLVFLGMPFFCSASTSASLTGDENQDDDVLLPVLLPVALTDDKLLLLLALTEGVLLLLLVVTAASPQMALEIDDTDEHGEANSWDTVLNGSTTGAESTTDI